MFKKRDYIVGTKRSYQLMLRAYEEAGETIPGTGSIYGRLRFSRIPGDRRYSWFRFLEPQILLYPESYVRQISSLPQEKLYEFNFVGVLFPRNVFPNRKWTLDFARRHFDDNSYFCITSLADVEEYQPLGPFDRTLENQRRENPFFVPREVPVERRTYFDSRYFTVLSQSRFTLCPRGDTPWSMRFFESVLCRSIPIVEDPSHTGRNNLERAIGYRFYTIDQDLVYHEDWVEENYQRFLATQTLVRR